MELLFHKDFLKRLKKLQPQDVQKVRERLQLFRLEPNHPILRDHALRGKYKGYRSIDIRPDLRALYNIVDEVIVEFVLLGTHSQLYK